MPQFLLDLAATWGVTAQHLALAGIGIGMLVLVFGLAGSVAPEPSLGRRMTLPGPGSSARRNFDLVRAGNENPSGLLRAFVPTSKEERTKIAKRLRQAGIHRPTAVRNYYLVRSVLALVLPLFLVAFYYTPSEALISTPLSDLHSKLTGPLVFQGVTGLVLLGFYGPSAWLLRRVQKRRERIQLDLPNTLDLLQVSIEAGLGFDAAIARVAHEMAKGAPEISEEFMVMILEIQAGKERSLAFRSMADRIGLEEVTSFVNVILQSAHFGSSVSAALSTYSTEMRQARELRAQEKANKLPVKMSAVLAALMMPTLLMICLTPVAIRWISMNQ